MPEFKSSLIMPGQAPDEATASCWSCGTMRAVHFCSACGKVQPPVPVDYFTFFGFPRKLNLDTTALEKEFYALSRRLHPDGAGRSRCRRERQLCRAGRRLRTATDHRSLQREGALA